MTGDSVEPAAHSTLVTAANPEGDLATKATQKIVGVVDKLSSVSAKPLTTLARALVFGFLGLALILAALVLLTVGALRLLDVYLPEDVWAAHLLLGSLFTLGGLFVWSKRKPSAKPKK